MFEELQNVTMSEFSDQLTAAMASALAAVERLPAQSSLFGELDDDTLVATNRDLAEIRRALDTRCAVVAGEVAARSTRENGYGGLAQRQGFRSPEKFIQHITGTTFRDAGRQVRAGGILRERDRDSDPGGLGLGLDDPSLAPTRPWLAPASAAVTAGWLSVDVLDSVARGVGEPSEQVSAEALANVVTTLLGILRSAHDAGGPVDADRAMLLARQLRDELDDQLVAEREARLHEARAFRRMRGPNGLPRYIIDPDIETAALIDDICSRITSPRRGGPRFVNEADNAWAQSVIDDPRTTDQYLHDAMVDLLRVAATAGTETKRIVGSRMPAVRVLVASPNLDQRQGAGHVEGAEFPVSIATVERIACTAGTIDIGFDSSGQPLNLGREQRLFSRAQRIALAARDGGCGWPGCDCSPAFTEAHHIDEWLRDHGKTDVADGILLCRFHHMLLHNNGWRIIRDDSGHYMLIPPTDRDPDQTPIALSSRSPALRDLRRLTASGPPAASDEPVHTEGGGDG